MTGRESLLANQSASSTEEQSAGSAAPGSGASSADVSGHRTKSLAPESQPFNWRWPNFTLADYNRLLDAQGGGCAIVGCARRPKSRRFSVDHDHATGRVRGILCHVHNRRLWAGATPAELRAMAAYLERTL